MIPAADTERKPAMRPTYDNLPIITTEARRLRLREVFRPAAVPPATREPGPVEDVAPVEDAEPETVICRFR